MLIGGSARARMKNDDKIASASDSCSIEKNVMSLQFQRLLIFNPCALRVLRTARHEFGFTYLTKERIKRRQQYGSMMIKTAIFVDAL